MIYNKAFDMTSDMVKKCLRCMFHWRGGIHPPPEAHAEKQAVWNSINTTNWNMYLFVMPLNGKQVNLPFYNQLGFIYLLI